MLLVYTDPYMSDFFVFLTTVHINPALHFRFNVARQTLDVRSRSLDQMIAPTSLPFSCSGIH